MKYRTAMGKMIDMGTIVKKNAHVRAVGNMNVNARGDVIDAQGRVVEDVNSRMSRMYNQTTVQGKQSHTNPAPGDSGIPQAPHVYAPPPPKMNALVEDLSPEEQEFNEDTFTRADLEENKPKTKKK